MHNLSKNGRNQIRIACQKRFGTTPPSTGSSQGSNTTGSPVAVNLPVKIPVVGASALPENPVCLPPTEMSKIPGSIPLRPAG
jgi:hypothetical protein